MWDTIVSYVPEWKVFIQAFNVQSVGRLSENWSESEEAFKNTFLRRAEQSAQQEVRQLVKHTLHKIQKEYKTDVAGFNTSLKIRYPKVWKKVEKIGMKCLVRHLSNIMLS